MCDRTECQLCTDALGRPEQMTRENDELLQALLERARKSGLGEDPEPGPHRVSAAELWPLIADSIMCRSGEVVTRELAEERARNIVTGLLGTEVI